MVEAEPHQRIGQQPFLFNSVMARLAKPECSLIDTAKRCIHSRQKLRKRSISCGRMQGCGKALAALLQFGAQIRLLGSDHRTSYRTTVGCCFAAELSIRFPPLNWEMREEAHGDGI